MAAPAAPKAPPSVKVVAEKEDKSFVETDAEKLTKYVCINYLKDGKSIGQ